MSMLTASASRRILTAIALLSATPALSAEPALSHFAHLMAEAAVGENAPQVTADFTSGISAGTLPLQFEHTALKDIQAMFGGDIHSTQEATGVVSWVCYTRGSPQAAKPAVTVWFISDNAALTLSMLVAQKVDAAHDGCTSASSPLTLGATGLPPLGASIGSIKLRFGSLPYDKVRNLYFDSTRPVGDGSGKSIYQRLGYAVKYGHAVAIAIGQATN